MYTPSGWVLAFMAVVGSVTWPADGAVLQPSPASGAPGSTVSLALKLTTGGASVSALQWTLSVPPTASVVKITPSDSASAEGKYLDCVAAQAGMHRCILLGLNALPIEDGVVANVSVGLPKTPPSASVVVRVSGVVGSTAAGDSVSLQDSSTTVDVVDSSTAISTLGCAPNSIVALGTALCTLTLARAAGPGGATVSIGYTNNSGAGVTMPASVTVPAGSTTATFTFQVNGVQSAGTIAVTASLNGSGKTATVAVSPASIVSPSAQLAGFTCTSLALNRSGSTTCTLTLSKAAPAGGATVNITAGGVTAAVPPTVTIPAGATSSTFAVVVSAGANAGTLSLIATLNGSTKSVGIAVAAPGCSYTLSDSTVQTAADGGTISVRALASAPSCSFSADSDSSWAQVTPLSGTGNATVQVRVFPNFSTGFRQAVIRVAGQQLAITQSDYNSSEQERFVRLLYHSFLGRIPNTAEIELQVRALATATPASLADAFFATPEFNRTGRFVAGLYVGLLDRDAEFGGWLYQRDAVNRGAVLHESLVGGFLTTPEYVAKFGNPNNAEFVRLLYRHILLREPASAEVDFQVAALKSPADRVNMASAFLNSAEFQKGAGPRLSAFLLYACLLQRDPSPAELSLRAGQIASGMPVSQLIDAILQSEEMAEQLR